MNKIIDLEKAFTIKLSKIETSKQSSEDLEFIGKSSLNLEVGSQFSMISELKSSKNSVRIIQTKNISEVTQKEPHIIEFETENGNRFLIEIIQCPLIVNSN